MCFDRAHVCIIYGFVYVCMSLGDPGVWLATHIRFSELSVGS